MDAFEDYFKIADMDNDGKIGGYEADRLFRMFGLPHQVVEQIWRETSRNEIGFLHRQEFFNAMRLVTVAQSGSTLTPEIVTSALCGPKAAQIPAPEIKNLWACARAAPEGTPSLALLFPKPTTPPYSQMNASTRTQNKGEGSWRDRLRNSAMNDQLLAAPPYSQMNASTRTQNKGKGSWRDSLRNSAMNDQVLAAPPYSQMNASTRTPNKGKGSWRDSLRNSAMNDHLMARDLKSKLISEK